VDCGPGEWSQAPPGKGVALGPLFSGHMGTQHSSHLPWAALGAQGAEVGAVCPEASPGLVTPVAGVGQRGPQSRAVWATGEGLGLPSFGGDVGLRPQVCRVRPCSPRVGCHPGSQPLLCPLTLAPSGPQDFQPWVSPTPRTPACLGETAGLVQRCWSPPDSPTPPHPRPVQLHTARALPEPPRARGPTLTLDPAAGAGRCALLSIPSPAVWRLCCPCRLRA